jgi:hypothetical protein
MSRFEHISPERREIPMQPEAVENYFHPTRLIDTHRIAIDQLFDSDEAYAAFSDRFARFMASTPHAENIMSLANGELYYRSESFIPPYIDETKSNMLLVLGNPAPESIAMEAMFAYEGQKGRYHRFWRVLSDTGVLQFAEHPDQLDPQEKMNRLYTGEYDSPCNVFITPFYSFPTPPGGEWNGVAGVRRLFGSAFSQLEQQDLQRMQQLCQEHVRSGDAILAFQKDAFVNLAGTQSNPPAYNYRELLQRPLACSFAAEDGEAQLLCVLPTRLLHSKQTKNVLGTVARHGRYTS